VSTAKTSSTSFTIVQLANALPQDWAEALREVEDALTRIRQGTYGQCEKTGRPMPKAQLVARPWQRVAARLTH
jgi:RNA polymerase-binding transcription factor DksA